MKLSFALAIAAFGAATPALADPAATQIARPAESGSAAVDPRADQRRVCVVSDVTGSRIPVKHCKTRAAWIAQDGVDPLNRR